MRRWLLALASLLGVAALALVVVRWQAAPPEFAPSIDLAQALSDEAGAFAQVKPGQPFSFPADHGEHPEFKTEWWYFTGNLQDPQSEWYGYQLTFFRAGQATPEGGFSQSPWSPRDVMMAHFAVSDPENGRFFPYERFSRRAIGLAGVEQKGSRVSVWLETWRMERGADGLWTLTASETMPDGSPLKLDLRLEEGKPPVLQGQDGYSRKGPEPQQSSYYVSLTRMPTTGSLEFGQRKLSVTGLSWFDHEWSSQAMAPGLVGWDWFSLQLDDGWDVMLYLLRYQDGHLEPASSGSLIAPDGAKTPLALADFQVEVGDHHTSPRGVSYPSAWTLSLPHHALNLRLSPRLADQEMASGVPYWEGAVTLAGEHDGKSVKGSGFVEMTGYKR